MTLSTFIAYGRKCIAALLGMVAVISAAYYHGELFQLKQPDGSLVPTLIFGDEYYQRVEDLQGYTLVRNTQNWICYATVSADQRSLHATDVIYTKQLDQKSRTFIGSLPKHADISTDAIREYYKSAANKYYNKHSILKNRSHDRSVTGTIVGLTVLIDFSDEKWTFPSSEIDSMWNQIGYKNYGNLGSVREYFKVTSDNKLDYKNAVLGYYRAKKPKAYYDDTSSLLNGNYQKVSELCNEVFTWARDSMKFDFTRLSTTDSGVVKAVNVLYAGSPTQAWAHGLWPHSGSLVTPFVVNKTKIVPYQMTGLGADLSIGTFCHENGHMILNLPDLYDYDHDSKGCAFYCLMGYNDRKIPQQICSPFRHLIGWVDPKDITTLEKGKRYQIAANSSQCFIYKNKNDKNEFFYIEAKRQKGYNTVPRDEGLFIWHVDWDTSRTGGGYCNLYQDMLPNKHYIISLLQADNRCDLEKMKNIGNRGDAHSAKFQKRFNDYTTPNAHWWNDTLSGLSLSEISEISDTMSFVVGNAPLAIIKPSGDDTLYASDMVSIFWNCASSTAKRVKIELSTNKGASFSPIAASVDNSGTYNWIIPAVRSSACQLKISEIDGSLSQTTGIFTITQKPTLALDKGAIDETVKSGETKEIKITITNKGKGVLQCKAEAQKSNRAICINELFTSDALPTFPMNGFEIFNNSLRAHDLSGWYLTWTDNRGTSSTFTFPKGTMIKPQKCVMLSRMQMLPNDSVFFIALDWHRLPTQPFNVSAALHTATGVCVDFVKTLNSPDEPPQSVTWNGPGITIDSPKRWKSVGRFNFENHFSAADWKQDSVPTPFKLNKDQTGLNQTAHWLKLENYAKTLDSAENFQMSVTLSAANMNEGTYFDTIFIAHNCVGVQNPLIVPVRMMVSKSTAMKATPNSSLVGFFATPIPASSTQPIYFSYNKTNVASASITIYDVLGNVIESGHMNATGYTLKNHSSSSYTGALIAVCKARLTDGSEAISTLTIGVKK